MSLVIYISFITFCTFCLFQFLYLFQSFIFLFYFLTSFIVKHLYHLVFFYGFYTSLFSLSYYFLSAIQLPSFSISITLLFGFILLFGKFLEFRSSLAWHPHCIFFPFFPYTFFIILFIHSFENLITFYAYFLFSCSGEDRKFNKALFHHIIITKTYCCVRR